MTSPPWNDDDALLAELRAAVAGPDTVPPEFVVAARAALAWRTVDRDLELAELTYDSDLDAGLVTRTRSAGAPRTMAFLGGGVSVEIEVGRDDIVGQLTPAVPVPVACQSPAGLVDEVTTDPVGCFVLRAPRSGPVRLRIGTGDRPVTTSWFCLG